VHQVDGFLALELGNFLLEAGKHLFFVLRQRKLRLIHAHSLDLIVNAKAIKKRDHPLYFLVHYVLPELGLDVELKHLDKHFGFGLSHLVLDVLIFQHWFDDLVHKHFFVHASGFELGFLLKYPDERVHVPIDCDGLKEISRHNGPFFLRVRSQVVNDPVCLGHCFAESCAVVGLVGDFFEGFLYLFYHFAFEFFSLCPDFELLFFFLFALPARNEECHVSRQFFLKLPKLENI